jgi:hypothetical protein
MRLWRPRDPYALALRCSGRVVPKSLRTLDHLSLVLRMNGDTVTSRSPRLLFFVLPLIAVTMGCGGQDEVETQVVDRTSELPALDDPFRARSIPLTRCTSSRGHPIGGTNVRVHGLDCPAVAQLLPMFSRGFSDANLRKPLVDRGSGWTCWQRLFSHGSRVQQTCWNEDIVIQWEK